MHFILIRESNELAAILFCREREEEPMLNHTLLKIKVTNM